MMAPRDKKHGAWWKATKSVHSEVTAWVHAVDHNQRTQRSDTAFYLALASNFNVTGSGHLYKRAKRLKYNLVAAGIETAASLMAHTRTAPVITTSGGDFALARKAEQRSRVLQSQFYELSVFQLGQDVFFDAATTGLGGIFGYLNEDGLPELERVLPNEIYVDDFDGRTRKPRSLARVRFPARETLQALYPDYAKELEKSGGPTLNDWHDHFLDRHNQCDRVKVYEIWHLPSRKGAKDGRHVLCTDNVTLVDEPWTLPRFPFAFYRYSERRIGFQGQGLAERLEPAQKRMAELARINERAQNLLSTAIIAVEEHSNIEFEDINNQIGSVLKFRQTPPQLLKWEGTIPDLEAAYQKVKAEAFEEVGLTNLVEGRNPAGAGASARAVRATDDIQSRRHICPIQLYQQFYLDVAQLISDLNDLAAAQDPGYSIVGRARTGLKTFLTVSRWADLALPDGEYRAQMMPMAALPTTIQGKYSAVEEWIQAGFVSKPMALDLLEFPDTEAFTDLENADLDLVHWQIERLLDGFAELPIENQDLALAKDLVNKAFLVAYRMEASQEVLLAFQNYLAECKRKLDEMAAAQAPAAPALAGGGEPLPPEALPPEMMPPIAA